MKEELVQYYQRLHLRMLLLLLILLKVGLLLQRMKNSIFLLYLSLISSVDDITALTTPTVNSRMTAEEKQYLQLLALSQLGGVYKEGEYQPCSIPAVLINQSGSTELSSNNNWLKPVAAKDSYEQFYNTSVSIQSFAVSSSTVSLPTQIRL